MQIKHILFLVIVVILWYIYLNKSISIETFNIGIPMRDEPNELLDCGNPFNTTIGDNTMEFYKANQLSDPLLLADNTYLFNGDNMLDPIHSNIDSSHGTELSVKCDQGDPDYRYSPYSSANRVEFKQLDGSSLQEQIATITCNAPIGLPDAVMNILRRGPPRRREELQDAVIGTNLRTCVISGCHSGFEELVDYELSLPPRMSMYSYENYGLCWMPVPLKDPSMFINFLLSIPNKYYALLLYLKDFSHEYEQNFIDNSIGLDELRQRYGKPIHIKRYQNLQLRYEIDYIELWRYIFLLRNIKHYTNICGSVGQDLMRVDHRVVKEGTLTMYTSSVEIQNYTPPDIDIYNTIEEQIYEGIGMASEGESMPGSLSTSPAGSLGFTGYFIFGGDYYEWRQQFDLDKIGPWLTEISMVYFNRYYEASAANDRFTEEELTITVEGAGAVTGSCAVLIKDYLFRHGSLKELFTLRFVPIAGGRKANYNFRIHAENYHLLRRIIQQLIISTCVSVDKRKLRIDRMDDAMVERLFPGANQTVKLPIFCFSTYLFDFFRNYSEGALQFDEVHPYRDYAIDETAGPYTSEDIRYVMEEIVDQIITKDGQYYEVYKNILINMGIRNPDPDEWITRYVSNTKMLERQFYFRCFQRPYEPPISRPFSNSVDYVERDPIHWLTHLWECWGFSDFDAEYSIHDLNADALLLLLQLFKQDDFKGLHIHTLTCMTNPRNVTPEKEASMNYEWEYRYNVDDSRNAVDKIGPTKCEKLTCDEGTLRADLSKRPEYEFVDDTLEVYTHGEVVPRYRKTVYTHKDVVPEGGAQSSGKKRLSVTEQPLPGTSVLVKCKREYENQDSQEIVCKYNWDNIQDFRYPGLSTTEGEVDFKQDIAELPDCMASGRLTTLPSTIEASQPTNTSCVVGLPNCEPVLTEERGELKFIFSC